MERKREMRTRETQRSIARRRHRVQPGEPAGVEERTEGVLLLLAGKASAEQLARRFGVPVDTVEHWRSQALQGIETALCTGHVHSAREQMLARAREALEKAVQRLAIQHELAQRAPCEPPEPPARRPR